jgi:hypothetical protein
MVNEDILTALKNAVDHGDNLDSAKQIMINSGYNAEEVNEASQFIGGGVMVDQQQTPNEELLMPNQRPSLRSKFKFGNKNQTPNPVVQNPQQIPPQNVTPISTPPVQPVIQQESKPPIGFSSTQKQLKQIAPRKSKHGKEIVLLIVLLILIGFLVTTILLKNTILGWFS